LAKPYPSLSDDKIGKFGAAGVTAAGWAAWPGFAQSRLCPESITGNYERSRRLPEGVAL